MRATMYATHTNEGWCPLKQGLWCHATAELAMESRCDCPRISQWDLYVYHTDRRRTEEALA